MKDDEPQEMIPILCKFWQEEGLWNGIAVDLPVAVFGDTFEEAMTHMRDALVCHLDVLNQSGKANETEEHLREKAHDYGFLSMDEVSADSPMVKMLVAMKNRKSGARVGG